jgi:Glycosyltransferase family 87
VSERARTDATVWPLLATLAVLVIVAVPELGSDPWEFRPGALDSGGPLGWLVRIADFEWDVGLLRASALLAGLLVAVAAALALRVDRWRPAAAVALTVVVVGLLAVPGVALQVGLRDASAPWFFTNDSTYQIELAGDLVLDGENPYGHDYRNSGLERFYSLDGSTSAATREDQVALRHFAYFPGTVYTAAVWRLLPEPFDDYRLFVLLATLGLLGAALLFPGPLPWRLAAGAALAASPLAVRAAWFGVADAPSILLVVLAFALCTRSRFAAAAACLAAAVLLKQFALVAVPFVAALIATSGQPRRALWTAASCFGGVLLAGFLPFLIADAAALYDDTIAYGAETYRIIGYGVAGILVELGVIGRTDPYPFAVLAALIWLPATAWLVWNQVRSRELWPAAVGFAVSIFVLLYLGRVLQNSYLIWPLAGATVAALLAAGAHAGRTLRLDDDDRGSGRRADVPRQV